MRERNAIEKWQMWKESDRRGIDSEAYENYSTLVEAVEKILKNFGTKYTINFV